MSLTVFRKCCKIEGGLPVGVKLHMLLNVALDFVIGLVPGAEALYRGNTRNALLLEDFLRDRAEETVRQTGGASNVVDIKQGRRNGRGKRSDKLDSYRDERRDQDVITVSGESSEQQYATKKRPRRPW